VWRPIVRDEERSGQENREEFLAAKAFPKTDFKNPAKPLIFMKRIRSSQLIKPFPEAGGAGFRDGKLTAVADKNLTRDERV
jgi:hypothetical protein